jgi:hypothetical protein
MRSGQELLTNFWSRRTFSVMQGLRDGKHVRIQYLPLAGTIYYKYKSFHSVQAVADGKFTAVNVCDYSRHGSDSSIYKEFSFNTLLAASGLKLPNHKTMSVKSEKLPIIFVHDEACPLMRNLIKPLPWKLLTNENQIYNYHLSQAWQIVGCAPRMLTDMFSSEMNLP